MTAVPATARPAALRLPVIVLLGVVFWFVAAMLIRTLGPALLVPGNVSLVWVFLAALPIGWAFVWLGTKLSGVRGPATLPAMAVMTLTATLLDGVALSWFPALYGLTPERLALGAALLLWGVGLILMIAYALSVRQTPSRV